MPERPLVFLALVALLTVSPGADMAMVARSVLRGGRPAALRTTLGIAAGCVVWALASALGVAALLAASETAYDALRLGGAAYLVWLGVQSLRAARRPGPDGASTDETNRRRRRPFRDGFVTNLFNPKIAVFYATFLPQFIGRGDPVVALSLALAGVHIAMGIAWLSLYAWALHRAATRFRGSRLRRALDGVTGTVLVALGLRLAAERR